MPNSSYRIRTTVNGDDNVVRVNLKQGIKTLNILSLEINSEDAYDIHTSDYGVIVGRVLANGAFGVPNVKVSVFIPISDVDENDYIISNEYPFKTPQSKDIDGVKYNLITNKEGSPGTFPNKRMVLDNNGCVEVFDKYWKYTATTNQSGDYMIFGIPTGSTQVHYDCDLSDIGILSQHPYDFIAKGYDANLFTSRTKFTNTDLAGAVHIISQDKTVFVYPFWGDKDANKIGITRNDIDINYKFEPSCVFMGSSITDQKGSHIDVEGEPSGMNGRFDSLITSTGDIEVIRKRIDGSVEELKDNVVGIIDGNGVWCYQIPMNLDTIGTDEYGNITALNDPNLGIPTRARVRFRVSLTNTIDEANSEYTAKLLIPCNPPLKPYYAPEYSTESNITYSNYYINKGKNIDNVPPFQRSSDPCLNEDLMSQADLNSIYEFGDNTPDSCFRDLYWGKVYSVKQYIPRFHHEDVPRQLIYGDTKDDWLEYDNDDYKEVWGGSIEYPRLFSQDTDVYDFRNFPPRFAFKSSCISSIDLLDGLNTFPYNTMYAGAEEHIDYKTSSWFYFHMSENGVNDSITDRGLHFCFENDWINGCVYFPRVIIRRTIGNDFIYFGSRDENGSDRYNKLYISGRHNYCVSPSINEDGTFQFNLLDHNSRFYTNIGEESLEDITGWQDKISVFSRVNMTRGIIKKKVTKLNENVFYYRCGNEETYYRYYPYDKNLSYTQRSTSPRYIRLYATDIILLGNMEDIYDTLPRLYESLSHTSATFPPVSPPKDLSESGMSKHGYADQIKRGQDREGDADAEAEFEKLYPDVMMQGFNDDQDLVDIYANMCKEIVKPNNKPFRGYNSVYSSSLYEDTLSMITESGDSKWKSLISALMRRCSLFFSLKIRNIEDFLEYDIPTFINTSRICELDVHNDSAYTLPNPNTTLNEDLVIPVNGMIDWFDIETNDNRSAFASMNQDINKYIINEKTGYRQYVTTPLYIVSFDGRLRQYILGNGVNFKYESDEADKSYLYFRYGVLNEKPLMLTPATFNDVDTTSGSRDTNNRNIKLSYCNGPLVIPENSFYFYFGLRSGYSAIDKLKEKYIDSSSDNNQEFPLNCYQNNSNWSCDGENIKTSVDIVCGWTSSYFNYYLYYKNKLIKSIGAFSSNMKFDDLELGVYEIVVVDAEGVSVKNQFTISSIDISLSIIPEIDNGGLRLLNVYSPLDYTFDSLTFNQSKTEIIIVYIQNISTTHERHVLKLDKPFTSTSVGENKIVVNFHDYESEVQVTTSIQGKECVETSSVYVFENNTQ